jgi:uncharacterized protein YpmB
MGWDKDVGWVKKGEDMIAILLVLILIVLVIIAVHFWNT